MELPLFPLHLVLFPGAACPLHVFEFRYREMMERVLATDRRFGVVAIRHGMEVGGIADVYDVGTVAEVEAIQRSEDGRMAVAARGVERFRIVVRLPDDPYPLGEVARVREETGEGAATLLTPARAAVHRYLSVVAKMRGSEVVAPALGVEDPVGVSFALADVLQIDLPDRQRLLEAPTATDRLRLIEILAREEARLLEHLGPPVGRSFDTISPN